MVFSNFYRGHRLRTDVGLTILMILLMINSAGAATLTVSSNNDFGMQSIVYTNIQSAIDGANDGDTIIVTAGTYYENLTISNKINLTITGVGIGSTILQPNVLKTTGVAHKYDPNMRVSVFVNRSTNVTIGGMTISGNSLDPNAVVFWNASSGEIKNSRITDTAPFSGSQTGQGIAVDASSGMTSSLNVTNVQIDGFDKNGIDAVNGNGGTSSPGTIILNVNGGNITGHGPTTTIAQNGILFWERVAGTVSGSINSVKISDLNYTPTDNEASGILGLAGGPVSISNSVFLNVELDIYASENIDASINNTFDGVAANSATDAQLFVIEDMIYHKLDNGTLTLGLVTIKPNNVYVTPASGSIQRGIDAVSAGGTVNVDAGTYSESLTIDKSVTVTGDPGDLSVAGPGVNIPILDGTGLAGSSGFKINKGTSDVIIEGFEIRNYGPDGDTDADGVVAWSNYTSNITVRDNYMHDLGYAGILIGNGWGGLQGLHDNWTITQNIIQRFGAYAVDLENAKDSRITNNEISDPKGPDYGINIIALATENIDITSSNITASGNNFTNYPGTAVNVFAWTENGTTNTATLKDVKITGNTITGNATAILAWTYGLTGIKQLQDITITGNSITVNNPNVSSSSVRLINVSGTSSFSDNSITMTDALGTGSSYFHGVDVVGISTGSWTMENNQLNGNNLGSSNVGIRIRNTLPDTAVLSITDGIITNFANGIRSDDLLSGVDIDVHNNSITGNTVNGVLNGPTGAEINATRNWWGSVSGPGPVGPGSGDNVSTNVLYDPWLPIDEIPPASVTDLVNVSYATNFINWTWTEPVDPDFANVTIYLDGVFQGFVPKGVSYYNAAVSPGTYTIGTQTVDERGNINATIREHTATTILPLVRFINGTVFDNLYPLTGIPDVIVTAGGQTNQTNATGFYTFAVPEGDYSLNATLDPTYYQNSSIPVSTIGEAVVIQDIALELKPVGTISGNVTVGE